MGNLGRRIGCPQFSLRAMLVWMTVVGIGCALLFSAPIQVALGTIIFLITLAPFALIIVLIYGQGYVRTFAIGAALPGLSLPLYT